MPTHISADCTGPAPHGMRVDTGTRDGLTLIRPDGWTDTSKAPEGPFQLTAPAGYPDAPVTFTLFQPVGIQPEGTTAFDLARQTVAVMTSARASFAAGPIFDCRVGSEPGSFYVYVDGQTAGYELFLIHNRLIYGALLASTGGLSDRAVSDYKGILGSWIFAA